MYGRFKFFDNIVIELVMKNPKLRQVLQRIVYPSGTREVTLIGQKFLIDCQSEIGYYRASAANSSNIFFRDELPRLISFISALSQNMTVVDAGANIGTWSVQIASLANIVSGLRVIAFEPNPNTFERLSLNCSKFPNITAYNIALSNNERDLIFYETTTSGVFSVKGSEFNEADAKKIKNVVAHPLDRYIAGLDNVALKIDVEGHEVEVLEGSIESIKRGAIQVVFSDGIDDASYDRFERILTDNRFSIFDAHTRSPHLRQSEYHAIIAIRT